MDTKGLYQHNSGIGGSPTAPPIGLATGVNAGVNSAQRQTTASEAMVNELSMLNDHLQNVSLRLYSFKTRMLGSPPQEGANALKPISNGRIGEIAEQIEALKVVAASLQVTMLEVERIG